MNIKEYEELFGKYEEQPKDLSDIVYYYATKKDCEKISKINNKHKEEKLKIPKRCKICKNCKYFDRYWHGYDDYDCYCHNYKNTWSKNKFGYREVKEHNSCDEWEWNEWQLVDPRTGTTLNASLYK